MFAYRFAYRYKQKGIATNGHWWDLAKILLVDKSGYAYYSIKEKLFDIEHKSDVIPSSIIIDCIYVYPDERREIVYGINVILN